MSSSSQSYITASGYTRTVSNNIFFGYHPSKEPDDPNKLTTDPVFTEINSAFSTGLSSVKGFALKAGSPAIKSGLTLPGMPNFDYAGNYLPADMIVSRGAFEYGTTNAVHDNYINAHTFQVSQNYPNPFNPDTKIVYNLPYTGMASVAVYDILGRVVTTLVSTEQKAGVHEITWNARSNAGAAVTSGIYFCRVQSGNNVKVIKMILNR